MKSACTFELFVARWTRPVGNFLWRAVYELDYRCQIKFLPRHVGGQIEGDAQGDVQLVPRRRAKYSSADGDGRIGVDAEVA